MTASLEWTDWYLTAAGWQQGSERLDNGTVNERPVPANAVLGIRVVEEHSGYGRAYPPQFQELGPDRQGGDLASLLDHFGPRPPV